MSHFEAPFAVRYIAGAGSLLNAAQ